jgi:hypothetical protein
MAERRALLVRMGERGHEAVDGLAQEHGLSKSEAGRLALAFAFSRPVALAKFVGEQKLAMAAAKDALQVSTDG